MGLAHFFEEEPRLALQWLSRELVGLGRGRLQEPGGLAVPGELRSACAQAPERLLGASG